MTYQKQEEKNLQEAYHYLTEDQLIMKHTLNQVLNWRQDELIFFLQSEPKKTKQTLLQQRNQLMEQIHQTEAEIGGRVIRKQPEPIEGLVESPLI